MTLPQSDGKAFARVRARMRRRARKILAWAIRRREFPVVIRVVGWVLPGVQNATNRLIIDNLVSSAPARPYPFSCWSPDAGTPLPATAYVSWTGLTDRRFTTRHLPPAGADRPNWAEVAPLFRRGPMMEAERSSALFAFFAQWFTEGFLRTHANDPRRNTSNHEIDLSQIYGLRPRTTAILRVGGAKGGGLLKSECINGAEFPQRLYDDLGQVKPEFAQLPYVRQPAPRSIRSLEAIFGRIQQAPDPLTPEEMQRRRAGLLATGLETGNATILHTAINTIMLRQHNRTARALQRANPFWGSDQLFEVARATTMAIVLQLLVNEYIKHIAGLPLPLKFDRSFAEGRRWYRTNRVSLEFNLLYRWHSLVPDRLFLPDDTSLGWKDFSFNNALVFEHGPARLIAAASSQRAGRLGLRNTPAFLMPVEQRSFELARDMGVRPYAEYRAHFGLDPIRSFEDLTGTERPDAAQLAADLRLVYRTVERLDFQVGLLAEQSYSPAIFGQLMLAMVGSEAFSHILTNPLLAGNVYAQAFPECCSTLMAEVTSLASLVDLNRPDREMSPVEATFDHPPLRAPAPRRVLAAADRGPAPAGA